MVEVEDKSPTSRSSGRSAPLSSTLDLENETNDWRKKNPNIKIIYILAVFKRRKLEG